MKRFLGVVTVIAVIAMFFGCTETKTTESQTAKKVGIAMPTQSSARWISDGANIKASLEKEGYIVDLQYAEDNIDAQVAQIENMITKGNSVLIIAAIDGESLTNVLKKANDAKVSVIAYDRLIRNSEFVSYYATFDNFKVGVQQATTLVKGLGIEADTKGPFNIELFAGSPDDNNAGFFFNGAMSVLQPLIDKGVLVVLSGQTDFKQVATLRWDGATAQNRMDNILSSKYAKAKVDAVLSPYDGISIGILSSLKSVGYGKDGKKMPLVSGQDCEIPSVKSMLIGEQYSSIFKDTRTLADRTVKMVNAILKGTEAEVNDTKTYDNGVKVVPSYLCDPVAVDATNAIEVLVGSGYYKEDQLK